MEDSRLEWLNTEELNVLLNALMFSMGSRTNFLRGEIEGYASLAIEIEDELVARGEHG